MPSKTRLTSIKYCVKLSGWTHDIPASYMINMITYCHILLYRISGIVGGDYINFGEMELIKIKLASIQLVFL